jgi:hypothetical protein
MASHPANAASALPAAAHVVGNAFVSQYYNVLHQSPGVVHRFYTDASCLTRAEAGADGAVETVVTQNVCTYMPTNKAFRGIWFFPLYKDSNFLHVL